MASYRRSIHDLIYGRQYNRILRLAFPNNDAPASQFLVNKLDAVESLSKDFEFTVELLSDDAGIALKEMQGKLLSIELVRQDGSLRYGSATANKMRDIFCEKAILASYGGPKTPDQSSSLLTSSMRSELKARQKVDRRPVGGEVRHWGRFRVR